MQSQSLRSCIHSVTCLTRQPLYTFSRSVGFETLGAVRFCVCLKLVISRARIYYKLENLDLVYTPGRTARDRGTVLRIFLTSLSGLRISVPVFCIFVFACKHDQDLNLRLSYRPGRTALRYVK